MVSCRCKLKGCTVCTECGTPVPRCLCPHGSPKKHRGEHGQWKTTLAKKQKQEHARVSNTYVAGDLYESPLVPRKQPQQQGKYSSKLPTPTPTQLFTTIQSPADLLRAFEMKHSVDHWYAHAPSAEARENPDTWRGVLDRDARMVVSAAMQIAQQVCSILCNDDEHAGSILWERVVSDYAKVLGRTGSSVDQDLVTTIAECYAKSSRSSIERRVLRACLCSSHRNVNIETLKSVIPGFTMNSVSFARGRSDLKVLQDGSRLERNERTLQRFDEQAIDYAVAALFSPENVSFLAWGTKRIKLAGLFFEFPAIMRRRARSVIFDSYLHQSTLARPGLPTISRPSFYRIASALTAGDATTKKAVDYVQGFLVNDAFDTMRCIISEFRVEDQNSLLPHVEYYAAYLKYGFDARVNDPESPDCVLHDIEFGLNPASTHDTSTTSVCGECKKVFEFYARVKYLVTSNGVDPSALRVVDDCCEKAKLFFAHRLRVVNQQRAIREVMEGMRERCKESGQSDEALVILDFKMKLEPLYYREKTVDHYGKRGMSWHGALIQYFELDHPTDGSPPQPVGQRFYCDHIARNDNKQDTDAVLSMLEAVLMRIKKDLPEVKRIVIQSDNAGCYQNVVLPLVFPCFAHIYGITITRFVHTETQDGKSILDAHFAQSMQVLLAWVREGNNCITPTQAVVALKNHGGLSNTVVELVEHDRAALKLLATELKPVEKRVRDIIKRANDVHIEVSGTPSAENWTGFCSCNTFSLKFYEYSGVGDGIIVDIHPLSESVSVRNPKAVVVEVRDGAEEGNNASDDDDEGSDDDGDDDYDDDDDVGSDVDGDIDVAESQSAAPDTIDPNFAFGRATGVNVVTQGQIRQRTKRWRAMVEPQQVTVNGEPTNRDIVSYAVRHALRMQRSEKLVVRDPRAREKKPSRVSTFELQVKFPRGWAVRPKRGAMYGRRYAAEFRDDIEELFARGQANKAHKIGPGRMREILLQRYPRRFDLPNESELRQEISKIKARKPRSQANADRRRRGKDDPVAEFFHALLDDDETTKPAQALEEYREVFEYNDLSDQQVKVKFSSIKSLRKRAQQKNAEQQDDSNTVMYAGGEGESGITE